MSAQIRRVQGHSGAVNAVRFNKDGNYCMTAGDDRTIRLWNPHKDDPSRQEPGYALQIKNYSGTHGYQVLDIAISTDNMKFASCGGDRTAFFWDVGTGRVIRRLQGHSQRINAVALNAEASVMMTASYDQTLRIWDLRSNNKDAIQTLRDFTDSVTSIVCTASSIIASSVDGRLRNYDIRSGLLQSDALDDPITHIELTHDGKCALCTCLGGILRLINLADGRQLQTYAESHRNDSFKSEACVSSDDCNIIACSEDGYFTQYGLVSGKLVKRIKAADEEDSSHQDGHYSRKIDINHALSSLSYHPSKPILLTASYDGTVKVWDCSNI